jgi:hypothetical protein
MGKLTTHIIICLVSFPYIIEELKRLESLKKKRQLRSEVSSSNVQSTSDENIPPYEKEEYLIGYGTNAMIFNNNPNEGESSEDEGIEDYKTGGYPPVHIG